MMDVAKAALGLASEVVRSDAQIVRIALGVPPKLSPEERRNLERVRDW